MSGEVSQDTCTDGSIILTRVKDDANNQPDEKQPKVNQPVQPAQPASVEPRHSKTTKLLAANLANISTPLKSPQPLQSSTSDSIKRTSRTSRSSSPSSSSTCSKSSKRNSSHVVMCMLFHNIHAMTCAVARGRDMVVALPKAMFTAENHKWDQAFAFMQAQQPVSTSKWVFFDGFNFYNTLQAARTKQFVHAAVQYKNPAYDEQDEEIDTTSTQRCMFSV